MLDIMNISPWDIVAAGRKQNPYLFDMPCKPGLPVRDIASGVELAANIPGSRYRTNPDTGLIESVAPNVPAIEDNGLRACPAFTQLATHTEDLTVWGNINGNVTFVDGYAVKTGDEAGWVAQDVFVPSPPVGTTVFASVSLIGSGVVCINLAPCSFALGIEDMVDTISGSLFNFVELNPVVPTKLLFRGVVNRDDLYSVSLRLRFSSSPVSYKIAGEGAQVTLSLSPMPYVPNNTSSAIAVVSEAATATTGMSFDPGNAKLANLKNALRGTAKGVNLWITPVTLYTGWTDDGVHYVSNGLNDFNPISSSKVAIPVQYVEISFTTGDEAAGSLFVYVSSTPTPISGIQPNTTYTVRALGGGTNSPIAFTSHIFTGKIIKSSISVKPVEAQGHLELDWTPGFDSSWLPNDFILNILSTNDHNSSKSPIYFIKDTSGVLKFEASDDSAWPNVIINRLFLGNTNKIMLDWGYLNGVLKMRLKADGISSSISNFSGSFGFHDLRFGYNSPVNSWIKNLKFLPRPIW